jgi:hypothetical protein
MMQFLRRVNTAGLRRKRYEVPHKYAFREPHFFLPLFAVWPGWLKSFLIKRFTLGTQQRQPSGEWQRIQLAVAPGMAGPLMTPTS